MTKKQVLEAAARGEGCLGRSADDEPVFVLVARDVAASYAVRNWASLARNHGAPTAKTNGAELDADAMDAWRDAHGGGKVPD